MCGGRIGKKVELSVRRENMTFQHLKPVSLKREGEAGKTNRGGKITGQGEKTGEFSRGKQIP